MVITYFHIVESSLAEWVLLSAQFHRQDARMFQSASDCQDHAVRANPLTRKVGARYGARRGNGGADGFRGLRNEASRSVFVIVFRLPALYE